MSHTTFPAKQRRNHNGNGKKSSKQGYFLITVNEMDTRVMRPKSTKVLVKIEKNA